MGDLAASITVHELKTHPEYFCEVISGRKPFEIRFNDRNFKVGDLLVLREYEPKIGRFTGRYVQRVITYIADNQQWLRPGYVVLGIDVVCGA